MKKKNSISELIESFDSFVSRNRSSFSLEEQNVLENVMLKLEGLEVQYSKSSKSQRRAIIQVIVPELLKILINPKTWNDIANFF